MPLINAYSTLREPLPPTFPHTLVGVRGLDDPQLNRHLEGFIGYVLNIGDGEMTAARYHLYRHLQRARWHYSLELPESALAAFAQWAQAANAVAFWPDGSVRDDHGRVLVARDQAQVDADAEVPYPADAHARKTRTDDALTARQLEVPPTLPPVLSEGEALPRDADAVALRMQALFAVAVRGESLQGEEPLTAAEIREHLPAAWLALSPQEQAFMASDSPDEQALIDAVWRYESVAILQWALGLTDELPFPDTICDVSQAAQRALAWAESDPPPMPTLRPLAEILDALDLHLRLHWLLRQARLDDIQAPVGLIGGVIAERHLALNWLLRFEDRDWDEVDTPT